MPRALAVPLRTSFAAGLMLLASCARPGVHADLGPLVSDRPDFTERAQTIAKGFTQVDLRAGLRTDAPMRGYFVGAGVVRRF